MNNAIPKMITLNEASELSGLSYDFLRKRCMDGTLVHIRSGRKYLINADKLAEYLNEGCTDNTAESACEDVEYSTDKGDSNG